MGQFIRAWQVDIKQEIPTSGGMESAEAGEWVVKDGNNVYLRSNRQFQIMYEPTDVKGIYKER